MLRRLQRSASQPAGSENSPKAIKDAVDSAMSSRIGAAVGDLQLNDDGRIDQHHEMIERVRPIEKADGQPPLRQIGGLGG